MCLAGDAVAGECSQTTGAQWLGQHPVGAKHVPRGRPTTCCSGKGCGKRGKGIRQGNSTREGSKTNNSPRIITMSRGLISDDGPSPCLHGDVNVNIL